MKSNRVREQSRPDSALYTICNEDCNGFPTVIWDIACKLTLTKAGPSGRTFNEMASMGRMTVRSLKSLDDELKIRLKAPSTGEQNDISMVATAAYFSGRIVMLIGICGRQNTPLASVPDDSLNNINLPKTVFEMGTKFESMKICKSELAVLLI